MTLEFIKTADHPLVAQLEQHMKEKSFELMQKEVHKKLSSDFEVLSPIVFRTPGEDYLEWIDIVESVSSAKDRFVMFELGAGYGRWCINALHALRFFNPIPFHFVAVEAETAHFRFLQEYFRAYNLNPADYRLIKAAVEAENGHAVFHMGDPNTWYGQFVDSQQVSWMKRLVFYLQNMVKKDERRKEIVRAVTLNSLLESYDYVDLIDMDIQSSELPVLKASVEALNKKVKRIHVGTHRHDIDEGLNQLFTENNWKNVHLFPSFTKLTTPYGLIDFNDGIQSWINPAFT